MDDWILIFIFPYSRVSKTVQYDHALRVKVPIKGQKPISMFIYGKLFARPSSMLY